MLILLTPQPLSRYRRQESSPSLRLTAPSPIPPNQALRPYPGGLPTQRRAFRLPVTPRRLCRSSIVLRDHRHCQPQPQAVSTPTPSTVNPNPAGKLVVSSGRGHLSVWETYPPYRAPPSKRMHLDTMLDIIHVTPTPSTVTATVNPNPPPPGRLARGVPVLWLVERV